jgi:hypothetical protein
MTSLPVKVIIEEPEVVPPAPEPVPVAPAAAPAAPAVTGYTQLSEDEIRRVNNIKEKFADTIGYLKVLRDSFHDADVQRCLSVAITEAETASMWAVRAVTWRG